MAVILGGIKFSDVWFAVETFDNRRGLSKMGLFFDLLSAINNPDQKASVGQLSDVTNTIQQLASNNGIEPSTMQMVLSSLGGALRPALRQQAATGNLDGLMGLSGMGTATGGGLSSLLTPQLQQQLVQAITQKTGVDTSTLQAMLPALIPVVMQILNMGTSTSGRAASNPLSNPLLKSFLDSDRDQDVDLGDVFKFGSRFLNPPR
jgi:hypothetical protein